jgi:hypothetical protein
MTDPIKEITVEITFCDPAHDIVFGGPLSLSAVAAVGLSQAQAQIEKIQEELEELMKSSISTQTYLETLHPIILQAVAEAGPQERLAERYPVLEAKVAYPCACQRERDLVKHVIAHLNDSHHPANPGPDGWDRQRIAQWLRDLPLDITHKEAP